MEASVPVRSRRPAGNTATVWLKIIALAFMFIDHAGKMLFPAVPEMRILGRVAFPVCRHGLRNVDDAQSRRAHYLAGIRLKLSGHELHQSRLALSVAPRQRGAKALGYGNGHAVQHGRTTEGE